MTNQRLFQQNFRSNPLSAPRKAGGGSVLKTLINHLGLDEGMADLASAAISATVFSISDSDWSTAAPHKSSAVGSLIQAVSDADLSPQQGTGPLIELLSRWWEMKTIKKNLGYDALPAATRKSLDLVLYAAPRPWVCSLSAKNLKKELASKTATIPSQILNFLV